MQCSVIHLLADIKFLILAINDLPLPFTPYKITSIDVAECINLRLAGLAGRDTCSYTCLTAIRAFYALEYVHVSAKVRRMQKHTLQALPTHKVHIPIPRYLHAIGTVHATTYLALRTCTKPRHLTCLCSSPSLSLTEKKRMHLYRGHCRQILYSLQLLLKQPHLLGMISVCFRLSPFALLLRKETTKKNFVRQHVTSLVDEL
mmetsp:Transcript_27700/g.56013  ORF Transcript_27700/g.56013 Transcript_27700/m.56013 type:complete len:202 (-) Transcript_27700:382-987(-)